MVFKHPALNGRIIDSQEAEIARLREALAPFAALGALLNLVSVEAMPDGASARFLKLDGIEARHFRAAANAINRT